MKICVDLDGTICKNKTNDQNYYELEPIENAVETLNYFKNKGYYIIIHTARGMRTYNNNEGKIIANHSNKIIEWLKKWNIPFDELLFAKPDVDCFIDDKGYRFNNWNDTKIFLENKENNKDLE